MIDIHMHVIPDVDDGSNSLEESLMMLRSAAEQGVTAVIATPHNSAFDFQHERVGQQYELLREAVQAAGIPVQLYMGTEILCYKGDMDEILSLLREGIYPTINGTRYVLAEFFPNISPRDAMSCLSQLQDGGYLPIIAHAERFRFTNPDTADQMRRAGFLIQCNVYSIVAEQMKYIRERANLLLQNHLVDFTGSDAHGSRRRPPLYSAGIEHLRREYGNEYADQILYKNAAEKLLADARI